MRASSEPTPKPVFPLNLLPVRLVGAIALCSLPAGLAAAGELASYRAHYGLTLASARASSGVVGAGGEMIEEWAETCDGWTEQQHFYLHLMYEDEDPDTDAFTTYYEFVSWEAKDAQRYHFDMRQATSERPYHEVKGEAKLDLGSKPGGGKVQFARPEPETLSLGPGSMFPMAYLRLVIARAEAGDQLVTRDVFDGSTVDSAGQVAAAIGPPAAPKAGQDEAQGASPLLNRPSWPVAFAFFPSDRGAETPDYEESVHLLDNGIMRDMTFDYGDYAVAAQLDQIEALPRPRCR
jgi:EipB-like